MYMTWIHIYTYIDMCVYICAYTHINISNLPLLCRAFIKTKSSFPTTELNTEKPEQNPTVITRTMKKLLLEYIFSLSKPIEYSIIKQHISNRNVYTRTFNKLQRLFRNDKCIEVHVNCFFHFFNPLMLD